MERRDFLKKSALAALGTAMTGTGLAQAFNHIGNDESKTGKMKITVLTGSPRAKGNSAYLAEQFIILLFASGIQAVKQRTKQRFLGAALFGPEDNSIIANADGLSVVSLQKVV